jgi:hypothetical protein
MSVKSMNCIKKGTSQKAKGTREKADDKWQMSDGKIPFNGCRRQVVQN